MVDPAPTYQRLTRNGLGLAGTGALWLGPDHLLLVSNSFGVERYRRWFFKDIQSLVARRTARRLVLNLVAGGTGTLLALGAFASYTAVGTGPSGLYAAIVLGFFAAVCLGLGLANTLLGAGCVLHVQTPMGTEKLNVPRRLNAFNRIAARIAPLIEAAQRKTE